MGEDGAVTLDLLALGDRCEIGHGTITYSPDDPQYRAILDHIGGLSPGETKPVRPWPEEAR